MGGRAKSLMAALGRKLTLASALRNGRFRVWPSGPLMATMDSKWSVDRDAFDGRTTVGPDLQIVQSQRYALEL